MQHESRPRFRTRLATALAIGAVLGGAVGLGGVATVAAADPQAIELEIESTISITKYNGAVVVDGAASVIGRIRLEAGATPGTWRGRSELASTTTSGKGGCGSTHIEGTGTYDWVVNEVVVAPGIEPERIVAHMDAGTTVEAPDAFEYDICGAVIEGTLNTWENLFFIIHNADFGENGLAVRGWTLEATGSSWADGELVASASWAASCANPDVTACTEETVFRLYSIGATTGGATATPPGPSATPEPPAGGGGLAVATVDPAGGRVTHACLELWSANADGNRGTLVPDSRRCDHVLDPRGQLGPQDGRPDGSLGWSGLAPGRYVIVETLPPIDAANAGYALAEDTPAEIVAGAVTHVSLTHFRANALTIFKVDAAGDPVPGACFTIERQASGQTRPTGSALCDDAAPATPGTTPADGLADGILVLPSNDLTLSDGTYTLSESKAPDGYAAQTSFEPVELSPASATVLTVTNDTGSGGGLAVATVDPAGGRVTHACLELWSANADGNRGTLVPDSRRCDHVLDPRGQLGPQDGRPDGSLGWSGLAPGRYVIVETLPPIDAANAGYALAEDTPAEIVAGAVTHVSLTHFRANALTIFKVDAAGDPVPGACFTIERQASGQTRPTGSALCDDAAPATPGTTPADGLADGILVLPSNDLTLSDGTYTLSESKAPDGYAAQTSFEPVELSPASATVLTVTNDTGSGGGLAVATVDPAGGRVTHACLELWSANADGNRGTLVPDSRRCDHVLDPRGQLGPQDGRPDGSLGWSGLAPGRYVIVETLPPIDAANAGYALAEDTPAEIVAGAVTHVSLTHFRANALTIFKVDAAGDPVPGACFTIERQASGQTRPTGSALCDDAAPATPGTTPADGLADGILVLPSNDLTLSDGTYTLSESKAPDGYAAQTSFEPVELSPASATVLTVTNETGVIVAPGATPGPAPTEGPGLGPIAGPPCTDIVDCFTTYWPIALGALGLASLAFFLGAQLLTRRTISIDKIPSPTFNAEGGLDPAMSDISIADGGLNLEKVSPLLDKVEPLVAKIEPVVAKIEPLLDKVEPLLDKVEPLVEIDPGISKIDPGISKIDPGISKIDPGISKIDP